MNSDGNIEAASTVNSRNTASFSPYGYSCAIPVGEEVILIPSNDGQVLLGTKSDSAGLAAGEVKITSAGGAGITLKNDGRVIINGRVFLKKDGEAEREL